jgi:putative Mg2+ transporter-C (MgtC) family protein
MLVLATQDMIIRLVLAALLGSVVGIERERLRWAAGLRTHMLVCVGSCLFLIVSAFGFSEALVSDRVQLDPSRVAAQVVSGIGFLGAGTILLRGEIVKGLTTAASLWAVAAIGLAVGSGLYIAAVTTTVIMMIILAGVKPLEERLHKRLRRRELRIRCRRGVLNARQVEARLQSAAGNTMRRFVVQPGSEEAVDEVSIVLRDVPPQKYEALIERLRKTDGVIEVEEVASSTREDDLVED